MGISFFEGKRSLLCSLAAAAAAAEEDSGKLQLPSKKMQKRELFIVASKNNKQQKQEQTKNLPRSLLFCFVAEVSELQNFGISLLK